MLGTQHWAESKTLIAVGLAFTKSELAIVAGVSVAVENVKEILDALVDTSNLSCCVFSDDEDWYWLTQTKPYACANRDYYV